VRGAYALVRAYVEERQLDVQFCSMEVPPRRAGRPVFHSLVRGSRSERS
jgi:hypothetical protein